MSKLIVNEIEKYDAGQLTITTGTNVSIGSDLTVSGSIAGTLSTAAQTNITSVGTLSSLAVSGDLTVDTSTLKVDAANNRVGIGTSSPSTRAHILNSALSGFQERTGATLTLENSGDTELYIASGDANTGQLRFGDSASNFRGAISYDHSSDSFLHYTAGSEKMRIDSSGNVGIGQTPASTVALDVKESDASADLIMGLTAGTGGRAQIRSFSQSDSTTAELGFYTVAGSNTFERVRILSSGNVGIGTSSPDTLLHLTKNLEPELKFEATDTSVQSGESLGTISWYSNDASAGGVGERAFITSTAENAGTQYNLSFGTGSAAAATERMRITSGGSLTVGTTDSSPYTSTDAFVVALNEGTKYAAAFGATDTNDRTAIALVNPNGLVGVINTKGLGIGISFGGAGDSDTLDDYEEGTFTPEIADAATGGNTATISSTTATYTKVGRSVTISVVFSNINTSGMTGANDMYIRNLPFTPSSSSIGTLNLDDITFAGDYVVAVILASSTHFRLNEVTSGGSDTQLSVNSVDSTASDIFISATYFAS